MIRTTGGAFGARHRQTRRTTGAAAWLALWAFVLHAVIPTGFMPGRGADGSFALVICGPSAFSAEAAEALAALGAGLSGPSTPSRADDTPTGKAMPAPCSFAAAAALAMAEGLALIEAPAVILVGRLVPPVGVVPRRAVSTGLGARGPPTRP